MVLKCFCIVTLIIFVLDYLLFNFNKTRLCLLFYNLILIMNMEQMNFMSIT